jgi:hypothetical protein
MAMAFETSSQAVPYFFFSDGFPLTLARSAFSRATFWFH